MTLLKRMAGSEGVSSTTLILATAVFVALFSNAGFFADAARIFGASANSTLFIGTLFFFITSIFVLVLSAVGHRKLVKPVLIAFLMISSVLAYFISQYGTVFDYRMIANVFETDTAEARDLFSPKLLFYVATLGIAPSLLVYLVRLKQPDWKTETIARLKLAGGAAAMLAAIQIGFGGHYAAMMRDHGDLVGKVNPTYALYSAAKLAVRSAPTAVAHAHEQFGLDAKTPVGDPQRELVIMVVGETARADHWSLNGYEHDTNPRLAREDIINFPDFWSCATSTAMSVPCMFSRLGRAHFDSARASGEDNALDLLSRAGVSVLWRDNNSSSKGVADRVAYEDFKTPENNPVCDEGECRDEGMLHGLQGYIDKQKGDVLIVLHQMGNHGPAYYKRYPRAFERFTPACKTNDLGACSREEIANAYDNAILYTDYFLSKVIELLKRNDAGFETAMLYVADHGESLGEYGVYLHGMPYALAPDAQKHIPAVMWLGSNIKGDFQLDAIEKRRQQRWSHDNVFATLLGLFEIDSAAYDRRMELIEHNQTETAGVSTQAPAGGHAPRGHL
ncbi:MAG: phosphoethanolamine--lipid A transferase [Hyphomicrobiaceae bacterium]|nr:phosphoethanolamine--lipid A transferase [Hyphomicrobiaceae bacterium]